MEGNVSVMATSRIRAYAKGHVYLAEWMEHRGLSDKRLGERLGVARQTIFRYQTEQWRLNPGKLAQLASALDCEINDLFRHPPPKDAKPQNSLDDLVKDAPDDVRDMAFDIVQRLVTKAS